MYTTAVVRAAVVRAYDGRLSFVHTTWTGLGVRTNNSYRSFRQGPGVVRHGIYMHEREVIRAYDGPWCRIRCRSSNVHIIAEIYNILYLQKPVQTSW